MNFKIISLIVIIFVLIFSYFVFRKTNSFIAYFAINMYTIKPVIESYLPIMDLIMQVVIIGSALFLFIHAFKKQQYIQYSIFLLTFFMLIIINGMYNTFKGNVINFHYLQGLLNYAYIFITIVYLMNNIQDRIEFNNILSRTKYNGILLFVYSLYDKYILGLSRVGDSVNPNYLSQMSLILLLFYIYTLNGNFRFKNMIYCSMLLFTIISTGSSSGVLGLIAIGLGAILFSIHSKQLIIFSNYMFLIVMIFYILVILLTSKYDYGLLKFFVKDEDLSRIVLWQYTYNSIISNPLMGELYNSFRAPWGNLEMVTHNDFLRLAAELGIGSIFLLFAFVTKQVKRLIHLNKLDGFFLYSLILITLIFSLSHNNVNNLMFWLVLVLPSFKIFRVRNNGKGV